MSKNSPVEFTDWKWLEIADPDFTAEIRPKFQSLPYPLPNEILSVVVEDLVWGLSVDRRFSQAAASGYYMLLKQQTHDGIKNYHEIIRNSGQHGPNLGRLMAEASVPVLVMNDANIYNQFLNTVNIMRSKGDYTLNRSFEVLIDLFNENDRHSIMPFLQLLELMFQYPLTYNKSLFIAHNLPRAILSFPDSRRSYLIKAMLPVAKIDYQLITGLLDGYQNGLVLLHSKDLDTFIQKGIFKYQENERIGRQFLSLKSQLGVSAFQALKVRVCLSEVKHDLERYLKARTGRGISVQPSAALPEWWRPSRFSTHPVICFDGKELYLPNEIDYFPTQKENAACYKDLVRLEACLAEFETYAFDLEKWFELLLAFARDIEPININNEDRFYNAEPEKSDLAVFFYHFDHPEKALAIFTIFEHRRLILCAQKHYPGMIGRLLPILKNTYHRFRSGPDSLLTQLYLHIVLEDTAFSDSDGSAVLKEELKYFSNIARKVFEWNQSVEISAVLTFFTFRHLFNHANAKIKSMTFGDDACLITPFNRVIAPELFDARYVSYNRTLHRIRNAFQRNQVHIYRSDIQKTLPPETDKIFRHHLESLYAHIQAAKPNDNGKPNPANSSRTIERIIALAGNIMNDEKTTGSQAGAQEGFRYPEWDCHANDYRPDHVLLRERIVAGKDTTFFNATLDRYHGLVRQTRYAFERLKPEGLKILRPWVEGDDFDYRAMLDFAIDRKSGQTPKQRLYIKRLKQERDVGVLLLVDMSHSTVNPVYGSDRIVLMVEKEALVLFCEALHTMNDKFAVMGFSGCGRSDVDYYVIKRFHEILDDRVKSGISAMSPQRNTRMGAAIRHAVRQLNQLDARIKLLIILGDGFPNDVDYKKEYAIKDTKTAISEARAKNIFVHAITVNIMENPQLDDLYGAVHHNVISDVRLLPGKLLRIYASLTRR